MANLLAVLDSCVLYPMYLRDTLLRMAEAELYRVYWSQEILLGATGNLIAGGRITSDKALRLQTLISKAFPEAMIEVPEDLVQKMKVVNGLKIGEKVAVAVMNLRFVQYVIMQKKFVK